MTRRFLREIISHKIVYILLSFILIGATSIRIYNTQKILGFYYDQGRDALVIWDFLYNHKPFLIGPVTGLDGVYLGPLFYLILAPFYWIGKGNPVFPSMFLAILSAFSIPIIYLIGKEVYSRIAGLIAATISSFSYVLIVDARWLANPNPLIFVSSLLFLSLVKITKKGGLWWPSALYLIGLSLQLELASATFYIPAFLIFAVWQRKLLTKKLIILSIAAFGITLLPQIIFDFRHKYVLLNSLVAELSNSEPLTISVLEFVRRKIWFYLYSLSLLIWQGRESILYSYFIIGLGVYVLNKKELFKNKGILTLFIFLSTAIVGLFFFLANEGKVYNYYLIGYYYPFILLLSIALSLLFKNWFGRILVTVFFITFFLQNTPQIIRYLEKGRAPFTFADQKKAVNWVIEDANGREFNVDVYVPPVIPYAYDYLFLWLATDRCGKNKCFLVKDRQVSLLYTIYENDDSIRLSEWRIRQDTIGKINYETKFNGLVVERRDRL